MENTDTFFQNYRNTLELSVKLLGPKAIPFVANEALKFGLSVLLDSTARLVEVFHDGELFISLEGGKADAFFNGLEKTKAVLKGRQEDVLERDLVLATVFRSILKTVVEREAEEKVSAAGG